MTVGAAAAAAGAGTFAAFSDTENSNGNSVTAGTLDLTVDSGQGPVEVLSLSDVVPGDSDSGTVTLANNGNVNGTLSVAIDQITSNENGTNDPETEAGDSGSSDGVELESAVTVTISLASTQLISDTINNLSDGQSLASGETLNAGNSKDLRLDYTVNSGAGNNIQSDSVSMDLDFTLTQA